MNRNRGRVRGQNTQLGQVSGSRPRAQEARTAAASVKRKARRTNKVAAKSMPPPRSAAPILTPAAIPIIQSATALIAATKNSAAARIAFTQLPWLEQSPGFCAILNEYLKLNAPPCFIENSLPISKFTVTEAIHAARAFAWDLLQLQNRIAAANSGDDVEWERKWHKIRSNWTTKQSRLVHLLQEAADLFDSGQCDPGPYASVAGYKAVATANKHTAVDKIDWSGSENLRRWADVVKSSAVEVVFPAARPQPSTRRFAPASVGRSGRLSHGQPALRAMVVRTIAQRVPKTLRRKGGYSAIAELSSRLLSKPVSRQYVASVLKQRA